jgi:threonine synthase
METTAAFEGLECTATGERFDPTTSHHPEGGVLDPVYDYDAVTVDRSAMGRPAGYADLLPFPRERVVSLGEGTTPLVEAPRLAEELEVGRVLIKDEGVNPTGTFKDRGLSLAVTAAREHGASEVALASTGNSAQSAAAYAARAGLDLQAFVPSRSTFANKAMVNVHGGDMRVVEGRLGEAREAFADALAGHGPDSEAPWHSLEPFDSPYRHEGKKPIMYELLAALGFDAPAAVVYPFEGGAGLYGLYKAARECRELGLLEDGQLPALYAAQSEGCAPLVEAFEAGRSETEPWAVPDTVCGGLEIADPTGSELALEALRATDGGAVAVDDDDILESAVAVNGREGVEAGVSAGAAPAAAWALAEKFGPEDTLVLVNTTAGGKDADLLRSHLMGQGY